jgi:hypothetical protein
MPAYKVLEPLHERNLTVFPVVAAVTHDTSEFLTLDEGLRSGEVVVTEAGRGNSPLLRRHERPVPPGGSGEVNRLVLINHSDRPLLLLAGEIVTGGKQDRVIGADRIVPPQSEPIDLSVFCVEPGRWTGSSDKFQGSAALMAQPSVRNRAMAEQNQQQVWAEVRKSQAAAAIAAPSAGAAAISSYAGAMAAPQVQQELEKVAGPLTQSYEGLLRQLKERKAVGVVVAINGRLEWVDVFASEALLQKYWQKLVRSYAAEAITNRAEAGKDPTLEEAQRYLVAMNGEREVSETEADVYRRTETKSLGWTVFRLTSLLPKTGFDVHVAKMTTGEDEHATRQWPEMR